MSTAVWPGEINIDNDLRRGSVLWYARL